MSSAGYLFRASSVAAQTSAPGSVERLITLDVEGFPVHRYWYLVRRAGRQLSATADALWNFFRTYRDQGETLMVDGRLINQ